tara:strand:- start:161 stop:379 length:219 start_codon:yes stop_codon:yes gene_type:complete
MSSQYKENKFSAENLSTLRSSSQNNIDDAVRPNIDHLIKRILIERRRGKRNTLVLGTVFFTIILILYFFITN